MTREEKIIKASKMSGPMTGKELREMYGMVKAIYHHLGLDGTRVISLHESREAVKNDVLKWRERQAIRKAIQGIGARKHGGLTL